LSTEPARKIGPLGTFSANSAGSKFANFVFLCPPNLHIRGPNSKSEGTSKHRLSKLSAETAEKTAHLRVPSARRNVPLQASLCIEIHRRGFLFVQGGYLVYKKTRPKTHRIRPLRFLNSRERHRPDPPSVFLIFENVGPTGFSGFLRIKKSATDRTLCVKKNIWPRIAHPPRRMELARFRAENIANIPQENWAQEMSLSSSLIMPSFFHISKPATGPEFSFLP